MWITNPHGGGVGFWRGEEPVIYTSMSEEVAWLNYEKALTEIRNPKRKGHQSKELLLHCRVSTGGDKTLSNCHPFFAPVGNGMIVAHNGSTRHSGVIAPKEWSDTRTLVELWMPKNIKALLTDKDEQDSLLWEIGEARVAGITQHSRVLFNFPTYCPEPLKVYGDFSNYIFYHRNLPSHERARGNTSTGKYFKNGGGAFTPDPREDEAEWERFEAARGDVHYCPEGTLAKAIVYAITHQLSFAGALLLFKNVMGDYPGVFTLREACAKYEKVLDTIVNFYNDDFPMSWRNVLEMELPGSDDKKLLDTWMKVQGISDDKIIEEQKEQNETLQKEIENFVLENKTTKQSTKEEYEEYCKAQEKIELERSRNPQQNGSVTLTRVTAKDIANDNATVVLQGTELRLISEHEAQDHIDDEEWEEYQRMQSKLHEGGSATELLKEEEGNSPFLPEDAYHNEGIHRID